MTVKMTRIGVCLMVLVLGASVLAHSPEKFKARLAPAPPLGIQSRPASAAVAGIGSATATLTGRKLTVNGSFEKMASAATVAKLGLGLAPGARLDLLYDLTLTKGTSGTIAGSIDLTPAQVEGLKKGKMYIQINSEGAPNGHLLGWLLK